MNVPGRPQVQPTQAQVAYNLLAETYDTVYNNPIARAENDVTFSLVQRADCHQGHILDLGCGTGLFLEYHPVTLELYTGIDISDGMLQIARRKFPLHTFYQADMSDLSFLPDRTFNSIVSLFASFAYILEPDNVVAEIERLLAPGGRFFIMTLGARYRNRPSEFLAEHNLSVPWRLWATKELQQCFARFDRIVVHGMHALPNLWLKFLPYTLARAWLSIEAATLGRLWPAACYYQIVTGRKP